MRKWKNSFLIAAFVLLLNGVLPAMANTNAGEKYFGLNVYICKLGRVSSRSNKESSARRSVLRKCKRRYGSKSKRCVVDAIDCHYM